MLSVNGFTEQTKSILIKYADIIQATIFNNENIGTAAAINEIWKHRKPNENAIKTDDDVVINPSKVFWWKNWVDVMEALIESDPIIGQVGLKRKDLIESPTNENEFYRSVLSNVTTKEFGTIQIETCNHIMGTCVMHSAKLLNDIGYMWQPKIYGFDDTFMSLRSQLAGYKNCFIPAVDIDHIDEGATPYQQWKQDHAGEQWELYHAAVRDFNSGDKSVYFNPFE